MPTIERKLWENPVLKIPEYTVAMTSVILAAFQEVSPGAIPGEAWPNLTAL